MAEEKYILQATGICKSFPGVKVLDGAELSILPGEVHALMGENGAGKSTLMKIIMGIYTKDEGTIRFDGKEVDFKKPKDALEAGISMIHQELAPIPEMTVAGNVFLGREDKKIKGLPFVDKHLLNQKTQALLEENGKAHQQENDRNAARYRYDRQHDGRLQQQRRQHQREW